MWHHRGTPEHVEETDMEEKFSKVNIFFVSAQEKIMLVA